MNLSDLPCNMADFFYKALVSLLRHNAVLYTVSHLKVQTVYVQYTDSLNRKTGIIQNPELSETGKYFLCRK